MENKVYLFTSRNKDNESVEGFVSRTKVYYSSDKEAMNKKFKQFVDEGKTGELCRFYTQLNESNNEKLKRNLLHFLIDNLDFDLAKLNAKLCSLASQTTNQNIKYWLWDFDASPLKLEEFNSDLLSAGATVVQNHKTVNGYAVVTDKFDSRAVEEKWKQFDVTNKRADAFLLENWAVKE